MTVAGGFLDAAVLVLIATGALKLVEPGYTTVALRAMGLPSTAGLVRAGAAFEVLLGALTLTVGSPVLAALVAASFAAFSLFVLAARCRGVPITSCGCLGWVDTPPTLRHVAITTIAAAGCVWAAVDDPEALLDAFDRRPGAALGFLVVVALVAAVALRLLIERPVARTRR